LQLMELRIPSRTLADLHHEWLARTPEEAAAVLAVEDGGGRLLFRYAHTFSSDDYDEESQGSVVLKESAKVAALAGIRRAGHQAVEVHTHPFSDGEVRFSRFDRSELPNFARYVQLKTGRPYGALVFGKSGYDGLYFQGEQNEELHLVPIGELQAGHPWLESRGGDSISAEARGRFDRQVRYVGVEGQRRIQDMHVAIVGLGGTGSLVVQMLAHLGVQTFLLVDDDAVEESNLSRLAGAVSEDSVQGILKVEVARRVIQGLNLEATVQTFGGLRDATTLAALPQVDLIVGCVDNEGARLILSEVAAAFLVPYLDLGVAIEESAIGGRVGFYLPGGPCLACADEIDFGEAAEDLESEALHMIRLERGYARDRQAEAAVMPLNATVSGMAMNEFISFATGVRAIHQFQRYDFATGKVRTENVDINPDCPVCLPASGMGHRRHIDRYAVR
jgi:molybdopterin/thiamine biosynthesis adenylyltransferase